MTTPHVACLRLAPWPLTVEGVVASYREAAAEGRRRDGDGARRPEGWDGRAAERIVAHLRAHLSRAPLGAPAGAEPAMAMAGAGAA